MNYSKMNVLNDNNITKESIINKNQSATLQKKKSSYNIVLLFINEFNINLRFKVVDVSTLKGKNAIIFQKYWTLSFSCIVWIS